MFENKIRQEVSLQIASLIEEITKKVKDQFREEIKDFCTSVVHDLFSNIENEYYERGPYSMYPPALKRKCLKRELFELIQESNKDRIDKLCDKKISDAVGAKIESEKFIDTLVDRILRKQLKQ